MKSIPFKFLLLPLLLLTPQGSAAPIFNPMREAAVVIGNRLTSRNGFDVSTDIAIDEVHGKVYVADQGRHRVLRFSMEEASRTGGEAEAVFGQDNFEEASSAPPAANRMCAPSGVAVDAQGRLWVVDQLNHRVLKFDSAWTKSSGAAADRVLGQPSFTSNTPGVSGTRMSGPTSVVCGPKGEIYVSDTENNRILRFNGAASVINGASASGVIGQYSLTNSGANVSIGRLRQPEGLAVTSITVLGSTQVSLWVADTGNNRAVLFHDSDTISAGGPAYRVLGQPDFDHRLPSLNASGLNAPRGVKVTSKGVWVSDSGNNRVLLYQGTLYNNASASRVFGQNNFSDTGSGGQLDRMNAPAGLTLDGQGCLWVSDSGNSRVLRFEGAGNWVDPAANTVLGKTFLPGLGLEIEPTGIAIDPVTRKLFVCDSPRHRILRFGSYEELQSGAMPEMTIGQITGTSSTSSSGFYYPDGICFDNTGRLWVADADNHRVLAFSNAGTIGLNAQADKVLGQPGFTVRTATTTQAGMRYPRGLCVDAAGRLWVSDSGNNRVLRFDNAAEKANGAAADALIGHPTFSQNTPGSLNSSTLLVPDGLCTDAVGDLWVADRANNRIGRYVDPANSVAMSGTVGQETFVSSTGGISDRKLSAPRAVASDPWGGLWIADGANNRVVRVDASQMTRWTGVTFSQLLGQTDFNTRSVGNLYHRFVPKAITVDGQGGVWIADHTNQRVMRFLPVQDLQVRCRVDEQRKFELTFDSIPGHAYVVESSPDLTAWLPAATLTAD